MAKAEKRARSLALYETILKLKDLEDHLDAAVELAAQCGVSAPELMEMLRILLKEEEPHV